MGDGSSGVGDARTLVIHPASPTHRQLAEEQRHGGVAVAAGGEHEHVGQLGFERLQQRVARAQPLGHLRTGGAAGVRG